MDSAVTVTPAELPDVLLHLAVVRPVFVWGPPGIGKSALVRGFAASLGLDCVTLLGTQLAPEDLIGVPQLVGGRSRFAPPESIARDEPYCLFLDELNASAPEAQKAFYYDAGRADPGDHRRGVRRGAGPARARLPGPGGGPAAVHPAGSGLPDARLRAGAHGPCPPIG